METQALVPVAATRLDLATASRDQLVAELERVHRAIQQGWLDRLYRVQVVLREAEGHIYSIGGGRRQDLETGEWRDAGPLEMPWSIQGPGWDRLNAAAGVTVITVGQEIEWDGIMPSKIEVRRVAVGHTIAGTLRAAPVAISIHARHYRFERLHKAASYFDRKTRERRETPGMAFRVKPERLEPTQLWLRTETIGEGMDAREIGYLLDLTQPRVREFLEDSATFAKNLSRSAETIAGRRASQQWHGFTRIDPACLRLDVGGRVEAIIPITGWRSDLTRRHLDGLTAEIARGADVAEACRVVGLERQVEQEQPVIDVDPEPSEHEQEELGAEDAMPADASGVAAPAPAPSAPAAEAPNENGLDGLRAELRRLARERGKESFTGAVALAGKDLGILVPADIGQCSDAAVLSTLLARLTGAGS
jgi:hypothetical protein